MTSPDEKRGKGMVLGKLRWKLRVGGYLCSTSVNPDLAKSSSFHKPSAVGNDFVENDFGSCRWNYAVKRQEWAGQGQDCLHGAGRET